MRPRFAGNFRDLSKSEGAGNAGCALHPRSRVQCAQRVRTRAYRAAENIRHSLRNGFTAYNALSPVSHVLLPPSTPTSGRQDHTSLPYASAARVSRSLRVHRNPSLVVTTADALLGGTGWRQIYPVSYFWKSEIFLILINFWLDNDFRKSEVSCPSGCFAAPRVRIPAACRRSQEPTGRMK